MFVKKRKPGGTSHGYQWPKGGEWIEMPPEHAAELAAIQPDEFEAVDELPRGAKAYVPKTTGPADDSGGQGDGGEGSDKKEE